jgi:hypothetical protein
MLNFMLFRIVLGGWVEQIIKFMVPGNHIATPNIEICKLYFGWRVEPELIP